ncbi:hypothetical protein NDU88_004460 [Pleurodeles waltl]|uniref:Uncharacterized protein n=1 Tax=Pleurodeles waltl TaxID=8319 RepID=A0AAV7WVE7_PLEWA|nr:hypothetical protein NDU88_004460 [Pleurodeles waltl]
METQGAPTHRRRAWSPRHRSPMYHSGFTTATAAHKKTGGRAVLTQGPSTADLSAGCGTGTGTRSLGLLGSPLGCAAERPERAEASTEIRRTSGTVATALRRGIVMPGIG